MELKNGSKSFYDDNTTNTLLQNNLYSDKLNSQKNYIFKQQNQYFENHSNLNSESCFESFNSENLRNVFVSLQNNLKNKDLFTFINNKSELIKNQLPNQPSNCFNNNTDQLYFESKKTKIDKNCDNSFFEKKSDLNLKNYYEDNLISNTNNLSENSNYFYHENNLSENISLNKKYQNLNIKSYHINNFNDDFNKLNKNYFDNVTKNKLDHQLNREQNNSLDFELNNQFIVNDNSSKIEKTIKTNLDNSIVSFIDQNETRNDNYFEKKTLNDAIDVNELFNEPIKKICKVCGDVAQYKNYMVWSCSPCKTFFRRQILENKKLKCHFGDRCKINIKSRKDCSKCRLAKCLAVGMNKELVGLIEGEKNKKSLNENFSNDQLIDFSSKTLINTKNEKFLFKNELFLNYIEENKIFNKLSNENEQTKLKINFENLFDKSWSNNQLLYKDIKVCNQNLKDLKSKIIDDEDIKNNNLSLNILKLFYENEEENSNLNENIFKEEMINSNNVQMNQFLKSANFIELNSSNDSSIIKNINNKVKENLSSIDNLEVNKIFEEKKYSLSSNENDSFGSKIINKELVLPNHLNNNEIDDIKKDFSRVKKYFFKDKLNTCENHIHIICKLCFSGKCCKKNTKKIENFNPKEEKFNSTNLINIKSNKIILDENTELFSHSLKRKNTYDNFDLIKATSLNVNHKNTEQDLFIFNKICLCSCPLHKNFTTCSPNINHSENYIYDIHKILTTGKMNTDLLSTVELSKLRELTSVIHIISSGNLDEYSSINKTEILAMKLQYFGITKFVSAFKSLLSFNTLNLEDQRNLLKSSCSQLLLLRSTKHFNSINQNWEISKLTKKNQKIKLSLELRKNNKLNEENLHSGYLKLIKKIKPQWRYDNLFMTLLLVIILFSNGQISYQEKEEIKQQKIIYENILKHYLVSNCNNQEELLFELNQVKGILKILFSLKNVFENSLF